MYTPKSLEAIKFLKVSNLLEVLISLTSGKQSEAASIVNTDPFRDPLGEDDPEECLLMLILLAITEDLLVRDNNPGEQVQLAQSALLTLLFATLIGGRNKVVGEKPNDGSVRNNW